MPYKSCKYTCTIILLIVYAPREVKKKLQHRYKLATAN